MIIYNISENNPILTGTVSRDSKVLKQDTIISHM